MFALELVCFGKGGLLLVASGSVARASKGAVCVGLAASFWKGSLLSTSTRDCDAMVPSRGQQWIS